MLPSLLAFLFGTSLFLIHGTEGVVTNPVNVLLHDTSTLHVWVQPVKEGNKVTKVYLCPPTEAGTIEQSGQISAECKQYSSTPLNNFIEINDNAAGAYTLTWTDTTQASLVYVFEPKTVLEEGIRILFIDEDAKLPNFEGSYHFRAPFGWTSDPCGFNRSKDGLYHLFYQHIPPFVQLPIMHWGHAVSKDLINWIYLPIFMIPSKVPHLDVSVVTNPVNVLLHDATSTLHVWVQPVKEGKVTKVYLCPPTEAGTIEQSGQFIAECKQYSSTSLNNFIEINDNAAGAYTLTWTDTTQASLIYAFEPKTVLEEGIRILFIDEDAKSPNFEGSYHFRAPFGWTSDPCGFNRSKDGLYHLFYQHIPPFVQLPTMHWGHAVSKDLINWIYLPIFMIPSKVPHLDVSGHFTGSTLNLPNGEFGVFWAQRISNFLKGAVTEWREVQQYSLIRPDWDSFRDPVVFLGPGGYYYMTVGGERKDGSAGVVLLYKNKNKHADQLDHDWEYQGVLHEDKRDGLRMCECPMLIAMGDPLNTNTE
uniref:Glyco_hydro_32N domain-containing protein n=1 Tax=Globodera pallida TaxID=36090 RepID=A0A183BW44_GLOPA